MPKKWIFWILSFWLQTTFRGRKCVSDHKKRDLRSLGNGFEAPKALGWHLTSKMKKLTFCFKMLKSGSKSNVSAYWAKKFTSSCEEVQRQCGDLTSMWEVPDKSRQKWWWQNDAQTHPKRQPHMWFTLQSMNLHFFYFLLKIQKIHFFGMFLAVFYYRNFYQICVLSRLHTRGLPVLSKGSNMF